VVKQTRKQQHCINSVREVHNLKFTLICPLLGSNAAESACTNSGVLHFHTYGSARFCTVRISACCSAQAVETLTHAFGSLELYLFGLKAHIIPRKPCPIPSLTLTLNLVLTLNPNPLLFCPHTHTVFLFHAANGIRLPFPSVRKYINIFVDPESRYMRLCVCLMCVCTFVLCSVFCDIIPCGCRLALLDTWKLFMGDFEVRIVNVCKLCVYFICVWVAFSKTLSRANETST